MSYWKPGVKWGKYTKVWVKPIELWKSDDPKSDLGKLDPADQKMLVDLLHKSVVDNLDTEYTIVQQAGPDVLVIRAAITDAGKSKPVANVISSVVPIGLAVSYGKQAVTGTGLSVGDVCVEADLRDGQTNELLAAAVDRRAGSKAWRSKFGGSWGDVKLAFDWWGQRIAMRLAEETQMSGR